MVPPPCAPLPGEGRTRGPDGRRSSSLLPSVGWPVHPDLLPSCGAFRACVSPLKSVCSMNSKIVRTAATQAWTTPFDEEGGAHTYKEIVPNTGFSSGDRGVLPVVLWTTFRLSAAPTMGAAAATRVGT